MRLESFLPLQLLSACFLWLMARETIGDAAGVAEQAQQQSQGSANLPRVNSLQSVVLSQSSKPVQGHSLWWALLLTLLDTASWPYILLHVCITTKPNSTQVSEISMFSFLLLDGKWNILTYWESSM